MKKTFLKLLACVLSVSTILTAMPISDLNKVSAAPSNSKSNNIPTSAKVAAGIFGILTASAIIGGICGALSSPPEKSDETPTNPKTTPGTNRDQNCVTYSPNANFTNDQSLCYFHALMQQLYSIKSFRDFVENYKIGSNHDIDEQMKAFKDIFDLMYRTNGKIPAGISAQLAKQILVKADSGFKFGDSYDISPVWCECLSDVRDAYGKYCNLGTYKNGSLELEKSNIRALQVVLNEHKSKLSDLLVEDSPAVDVFANGFTVGIWADLSKRKEILSRLTADYFLKVNEEGNIVSRDGDERKFYVLAAGDLPDSLVNEVRNNFSEDLSGKGLGDDFIDERNSPDAGKRKKAFDRILARLPIGRFIEEKDDNLTFNQEKLIDAVTKAKPEDLVNLVKTGQDKYKAPCVKELFEKPVESELKDVEAKDDQFAIFVNRAKYGESGSRTDQDTTQIDFGDCKVKFKGEDFEVTAVTCHLPGHYYTYKKQAGQWYEYNDCHSPTAGPVDWEEIKENVKTNCTMITFTKPGANTEKLSISYAPHCSMPIDDVGQNSILPAVLMRQYAAVFKVGKYKDDFSIVETGDGTKYYNGIVDDELLEMYKNYGTVAIVDASNTGGLGGHGVDRAIFKAMGDGAVEDLAKKLPVVEGSSTRIPEGTAVIHGSYGIGRRHPNVPYVIQSVGPVIGTEKKESPSPTRWGLFYSAWYNAVKLGIDSGCDVIFMSAISMGIFCEDKSPEFGKQCARIAVQAILDAKQRCDRENIKIVFIDHQDERRNPAFFEELRRIMFET